MINSRKLVYMIFLVGFFLAFTLDPISELGSGTGSLMAVAEKKSDILFVKGKFIMKDKKGTVILEDKKDCDCERFFRR